MEKGKPFKDKFEAREDVVIGRNPVMELFKSGRKVEKLLVLRGGREGSILKLVALARDKGIPVVDADKRTLDNLAANDVHQGIAAYVALKDYCEVEDILEAARAKSEKPLVVVCENINDPHNLGAIIRSADAAGAHGVIIPKRRSVGLTSAVFKSSAGAAEHMPVSKVSNIAAVLEKLKGEGLWIFGTAADGETDYFNADFDIPAAIVIGSEGEGISRLVKEKCDFLLKIPMLGKVNSLNASAAAAVVLYEACRQKIIKQGCVKNGR